MSAWLRSAMRAAIAIVGVAMTAGHAANADAPPTAASPVSPEESLAHFVVEPGLSVELAASEPQVVDPVAVRFDEHGQMWVVEMGDYPLGPQSGEPPRSRISVLRDSDGDGLFESSTVFADNLLFATGVQPWRGGAFVTMAGEVAYMKDVDGDGRADLRETWFTGFAQKNSQLRANHPRLALDNHIYIANGLRGGKIVDARHPERPAVSISGMDFRFDPWTGACEAVSGVGQFGLAFDDFGNRFVCTNRNPCIHVVLENRYLQRNPLVAVPAVAHDVALSGAESRVFPLARSWTTSNLHAGQFTAACGLEIFRGDALGPEYYGNLLVCEPTAHLVQRQIMTPRGVTFEARAVHDGKEFLASRDPWFSPVNLETGPDGALYVVDMYRAVIEHPDWAPDELKNRPDQMLGNDRGRIYRIVASGRAREHRLPRAASGPTEDLVRDLNEANAWRRETAARLLLERQDKASIAGLRRLLKSGEATIPKIHAAWLLIGLGAADAALFKDLLETNDPRLLEQAILASDSLALESPTLRQRIVERANHEDARVRFAALLVGARVLHDFHRPVDEWERDALLIATGSRGGEVLADALSNPAISSANMQRSRTLIVGLSRIAAAAGSERQTQAAIAALLKHQSYCRAGLTSFFTEAIRRGATFDEIASQFDSNEKNALTREFADAQSVFADPGRPNDERCEALQLAALTAGATERIARIAADDPSPQVRIAAIRALTAKPDLEAWRSLLSNLADEPPLIRAEIVQGALARPDRAALVLDEIAASRVKPSELGAAQIDQFLKHADAEIQTRAQQLVASALPADRRQALADYQVVLTMTGDAQRGRDVFGQRCASCHRVGEVGVNVAPDISDSREKTAEQLLTDILQPNRAIDANYFSYTVFTADGLSHTGVLAAETGVSITLNLPEGKSLTLRRDEIEELRADGVSLMPEGLERDIPPQAMADVIAYIKGWRYLDKLTPLSGGD